MSRFMWSFAAGAAIIVLFSYDQLNRPSYKEAKRLAWLLELLLPSDIRSPGVFFRMLVLYTGLMLAIYSLACFSGGALAASLFGNGDTIDARAPLFVSLMMVGLMPNPKGILFNSLEKHLRLLTHRFFGIPDSLFDRADALNRIPFDRKALDSVGANDVMTRTRCWVDCARVSVGSGGTADVAQLADALHRSAACLSWVLDRDVWPGMRVRDRFKRLEQELRTRLAAQHAELELLASATKTLKRRGSDPYVVAAMLSIEVDGEEETAELVVRLKEHVRTRWLGSVGPAQELSRDLCTLMMLYLEQDNRLPADDGLSEGLASWLGAARDSMQRRSRDFDVIIGAGMATVVLMMLGGAGAKGFGWPHPSFTTLEVALQYAFQTVCIYAPAMFAAMSIRAARLEDRRWVPMNGSGRWPSGQIALLMLVGALITLPFVLFAHVVGIAAAPEVTVAVIVEKLPAVLERAITTDWPWVFIGAVQGVMVAGALDLASLSSRDPARRQWEVVLPAVHGAVFFVLGCAATQHAGIEQGAPPSLVQVLYQGSLVALVGVTTSLALLWQLRRYDADETGGTEDGAEVSPAETTLEPALGR